MPLSAFVDGDLVCAPLIDADRWRAIRSSPVTLVCGHPGFPRISVLGTQHFAHIRGSECQHRESAEHLHLKAVVASAACRAGWSVATEMPGEGFIADVWATRGDARVVFEVQRSRQVLREYERRQRTYERAGVRCVWFVAEVPGGHRSGPDLPLFLVRDFLGDSSCVVAGRSLAVPDVVRALLSGRCRWREQFEASSVQMETLRFMCPVCGRVRQIEASRLLSGACECGLPVSVTEPAKMLPDSDACCGYWGPSVLVRRLLRPGGMPASIPAGHWCLSAGESRA